MVSKQEKLISSTNKNGSGLENDKKRMELLLASSGAGNHAGKQEFEKLLKN